MLRMPGSLFLVATPIGNLEDITLRAIRVLGEVGIIACEDTRRTRGLLTHLGISKPLVSYHEHNESRRTAELIRKLEEGIDIALVSDAGMPLVSDPGYELVREAIALNIAVVPVPGASALPAALAASGLHADQFNFAGFLPARQTARRSRLAELSSLKTTLVVFEAPHRIKAMIHDALDVLGDRQAAIARELTKVHEEFIRGRLSELAGRIDDSEPRGEYVVVIGAANEQAVQQSSSSESTASITDEVDRLVHTEGLDHKSALKRVARQRGISKAEAYRLAVLEKADSQARK
ncbi:MAG TPA: 16S rRNA (cytidine(1402)-2'-O)-methyltransferase [Blastocatellia bacterium]|nr:16S rRNA (cytidine(1402)-2'-O)-methyltransferase [Blastocatellia bacterium]